jgi:hypothetical protein
MKRTQYLGLVVFRKSHLSLCLLGVANNRLWAQPYCRFEHLAIQPLVADKLDVLTGSAQQVEVCFFNAKEAGEIEVFPEALLTIRDLRSGKQCAVDGGVWVRKDVYLGAQGKTLLTHEYSGSNAFLMFYDTATCRKLSEVDVSTKKWTLVFTQKGSALRTVDAAYPATTKSIPFNSRCLPM